jgi:diguanylate cyclase (GGDEF)-like protein/PAS domain S-box-containing protein
MKNSVLPPLPEFLDLLLDTIFVVNEQGIIVYISGACQRLLGYTPEELTGQPMFQFIAPEDQERTRQEARRVSTGEQSVGFENRYIHKDGHRVHIMWSARYYEAEQLRIGVARDVTVRRRLEAMQAATYELSEATQSSTDLAELFQRVYLILSKLVPVAGFSVRVCSEPNSLTPVTFQLDPAQGQITTHPGPGCDCSPAHDTDALAGAMLAQRPSTVTLPLNLNQAAIGTLALQSPPGTHYSEQDLELLNFVSSQIATAVERKQLQAELERLARYDELTNLPNRRLFNEQLNQALAGQQPAEHCFAIMFIDIDDFKRINDAYGHTAGDDLLREVATRIRQTLRQNDTAFRLGGDEFVVLVNDLRHKEDARVVAQKLCHAIEQPLWLAGVSVSVSASIGVSVYPHDAGDADALMRKADNAMYRQKHENQQTR